MEALVNRWIQEAHELRDQEMPIAEAKAAGAEIPRHPDLSATILSGRALHVENEKPRHNQESVEGVSSCSQVMDENEEVRSQCCYPRPSTFSRLRFTSASCAEALAARVEVLHSQGRRSAPRGS